MKKLLGLAIALALLVGTAACGTPPPLPDSSSAPPSSSIVPAAAATPITDEVLLCKLWDVYMAKSPLMLNEGREDLSTLTPHYTTTAAITVWLHSNDADTLPTIKVSKPDEQPELWYYFTLDEAARLVERTFGMTIADPKAYFEGMERRNSYGPEYLAEQQCVAFMTGGPWEPNAAYGGESWGYAIEKATDNGDGTVSVTMLCNDDRVELPDNRATFVLGKYEDGSYYYKTVHQTYYNNNVANLQGNYRAVVVDGLELGFGLSNMRLLWQDGDSVILSSEAGRSRQDSTILLTQLIRVNTKNAKVEKLVTVESPLLPSEDSYMRVHGSADGIVISSRYGVKLYDLDLELTSETPLPKALTDKMIATVSGKTPEGHTVEKEFFSEFAITADGSRYCYSNHEGLFVVDTATGSERLLVSSYVTTDDVINGVISTPRNLQFVEGDSKVVFNRYRYEGYGEVICVDIATGKQQVSMSGFARDSFGAGNTAFDETDSSRVNVSYVDYATGRLRELTLEPLEYDSETQYLSIPSATPSSRNYLLTAQHLCMTDDARLTPKLYRVKLDDMSATPITFSMDTDYSPVGITDDGTAIISYLYSRGEYGLLLLD